MQRTPGDDRTLGPRSSALRHPLTGTGGTRPDWPASAITRDNRPVGCSDVKMMIHATNATTATRDAIDVVLEVPPEDQDSYTRHSYHDYMHAWNLLVGELEEARRTGDSATADRLAEELRHFWPRANAVARVAWVPDDDRESALPPDQDR